MNPLEIPKLTQYINDFSGIFTPEERENLNKLFSEHDSKTTEQVVVVLIPHRK